MACVYPIDCWRSKKKNENGKYPITFKIREANIDKKLQVPCGKCVGCYKTKALEWGIRCHHEAQSHKQNAFITLTYDDENCPSHISIDHLQRFIKRLRKRAPLRYFAVGEYGEKTRRPHYHALIFGQDFLGNAERIDDQLYNSPILNESWGMGLTSTGAVTIESCMYVAGYANKKIGDKDTFNLMSRRPGIGHSWLDKYKTDLSRTGVAVVNGQELPVPARYMRWDEQEFEGLKSDRKSYFDKMTPAEICKARETLRSKEINLNARINQKREKI